MKKTIIIIAAGLFWFLCGVGFAVTSTDIILWGFGGMDRAKEWVSPDGRMNIQNLFNNMSTAVDMRPTAGTLPTTDSISETTWWRTKDTDTAMERFNISAMATADGGAYRFGVERANGGEFKPMIFCFEDVSPGVAKCYMKIEPMDGVYVSDDGGSTWRKP